jgi:universal stress protein A
MAGKILVAIDFSCMSQLVFDYAASLAHDRKCSLYLLNVQEPYTQMVGAEAYFEPRLDEDPQRRFQLESFAPPDSLIPCEYHVLAGFAREIIVRVADEQGVDLIVVGSHGRKGLSRLMLGSVAEHVVRNAPCPVLVIRLGAHVHLTAC